MLELFSDLQLKLINGEVPDRDCELYRGIKYIN